MTPGIFAFIVSLPDSHIAHSDGATDCLQQVLSSQACPPGWVQSTYRVVRE
jgi:hypothetical protein